MYGDGCSSGSLIRWTLTPALHGQRVAQLQAHPYPLLPTAERVRGAAGGAAAVQGAGGHPAGRELVHEQQAGGWRQLAAGFQRGAAYMLWSLIACSGFGVWSGMMAQESQRHY